MLIVTKLSRLRFAKQKCKRLDQNLIEPFFVRLNGPQITQAILRLCAAPASLREALRAGLCVRFFSKRTRIGVRGTRSRMSAPAARLVSPPHSFERCNFPSGPEPKARLNSLPGPPEVRMRLLFPLRLQPGYRRTRLACRLPC